MDYHRESGWANLQGHIETLSQTLFNVRDANLAQGKDITDATDGVRAALDDLQHELDMWQGKLGFGKLEFVPCTAEEPCYGVR